jgi:hypothetical protein
LAFKEQKLKEFLPQEPVLPAAPASQPVLPSSPAPGWVVEGPLKELPKQLDTRKSTLKEAKKALKSSELKEAKAILEVIVGDNKHPDFLEGMYHLGSFYLYQEKNPHKAGEYFSKAYLSCLPLQDKKLLGLRSLVKFIESLVEQKEWSTAEVTLKEAEKKIKDFKDSPQGAIHQKEMNTLEKTVNELKQHCKKPEDLNSK